MERRDYREVPARAAYLSCGDGAHDGLEDGRAALPVPRQLLDAVPTAQEAWCSNAVFMTKAERLVLAIATPPTFRRTQASGLGGVEALKAAFA